MIRFAAATAAALLLATGASAAQMAAPAAKPAAPAKAAPAAKTAPKAQAQAPRTAASLECSKQADAKALHGKPRKSFMSSCKSAAKKG